MTDAYFMLKKMRCLFNYNSCQHIYSADLNTALLLKNNKKANFVKLHRNSAVPVQIKLPVTVVGFVI